MTFDPGVQLYYTWNARNQLTMMEFNREFDQTYDVFGRRETSADVASNETISLLHDGAGIIAWSGSLGDSWTFLAAPGGGALAGTYTDTASATYVPLIDAQGSAIGLVNTANGSLSSRFTYDPFGNTSVSGGTIPWPFQWHGLEHELTDPNGVYFDPSGNLYDPAIQRFVSQVGQQGLSLPGGGPGPSAISASAGSGAGINVGSTVMAGTSAARSGIDAYFLMADWAAADTGNVPVLGVAAIATAIYEIFSFFEDLFDGGGSDKLPHQLLYGRHPIYTDKKRGNGISLGLIVNEGSVARTADEEDEEESPEFRELAFERMFHGETPIIPDGGLEVTLEDGRVILILPGTEIGPARNGKGYRFRYGKGEVRIMGPVTGGKYKYPNGYAVFSDAAGNPVTIENKPPLSRGDYHYGLAP